MSKSSKIPIESNDSQKDAASAASSDAETAKDDAQTAADAPKNAEEETLEAEAETLEADVVEQAERILDESEELAQAKAETKDWQDKYLRLHAEWDTYRRRTNEQRAEEKRRAAENLVMGLLPVLDDFERTIDYAEKNGEEGLLGGVQAVHNKLIDVLKRDGVEVISPEGEAFNALEASAVATVDDPSVPEETVAEVYQKGYRMGSKVLRPAMVTVTSGGPSRPKEEAKEAE